MTLTTTTPAALDCQGLYKAFGSVQVARAVTLTAREGEFVTLLGPSGCGKTTTLRLIAGFETPDAGSITVGGRLVAGPGVNVPPEARRIGMVFQDYALFPHLSVGDNVGFGLRTGRREKAERVAEMLALVGLAGLQDRMPYALSGGQQQRVALARALAPQPQLLLLDEPFSNLDAALRGKVRAEVRAILKQAGVTVVFVTHDQEEALSLSDRVAVMFDGTVAQFDTPEQVYQRPADLRVAGFVGEANLIPAQADGLLADSTLGTLTLAEMAHGPAALLIRPEQLTLAADDGTSAQITWTEFYGHTQRVGLRVGDDTALVARLDARRLLRAGDTVRIAVAGAVMAYAPVTAPA